MTLGRPATGLPRYYMDCGWWRGPKWAGVDPDVLFVHSAAVSYCTHHASDGRMPADVEDLSLALGVKVSVVRRALKTLLDDGRRRWSRVGTELEIVGWVDHNPVAAEVADHAERQRTRGALGNHRRWHESRGIHDPDCPYCDSPSDSPCDDPQATSHPPSPQATDSPGESLGMGWDGMGTDDNKPAAQLTTPGDAAAADPPSRLTSTERQQTLADACQLIARRAALRPGTRDTQAVVASVERAALRDHHQQGHQHLVDHPHLTPQALADLLEPPTPSSSNGTSHPLDAQQAATMARAEAGTNHTRTILNETPDPNAANRAHTLANQLRHPPQEPKP